MSPVSENISDENSGSVATGEQVRGAVRGGFLEEVAFSMKCEG